MIFNEKKICEKIHKKINKKINKKIDKKIDKNIINVNVNINNSESIDSDIRLKNDTMCNPKNENIISKFKKIFKLLIFILSFLLIVYFLRYCYCEIKVYRLNKTLNKDVDIILNNLKFNLKSMISDTVKIDNNKLLLSQTLNINEILKISADKINRNIIDKDNGIIIDDEYLGIYKYYNKHNSIKKILNKRICLKNFFINKKDRLKEKKYNTDESSINFIDKLYNFIKSL